MKEKLTILEKISSFSNIEHNKSAKTIFNIIKTCLNPNISEEELNNEIMRISVIKYTCDGPVILNYEKNLEYWELLDQLC